jgi:hypothetical protein
MTAKELAAWGARSRAASGVPPTIEDEATLVQLARLMRGADEHTDGGGPTGSRRRRVKEPSTTRRATRKAGDADD